MEVEELKRKLSEAGKKREALELERQLREMEKENRDSERELHPSGMQKVFNVVKRADEKMVKFSAKNQKATKGLAKDLIKANTITKANMPTNPKKRADKLIWG